MADKLKSKNRTQLRNEKRDARKAEMKANRQPIQALPSKTLVSAGPAGDQPADYISFHNLRANHLPADAITAGFIIQAVTPPTKSLAS